MEEKGDSGSIEKANSGWGQALNREFDYEFTIQCLTPFASGTFSTAPQRPFSLMLSLPFARGVAERRRLLAHYEFLGYGTALDILPRWKVEHQIQHLLLKNRS